MAKETKTIQCYPDDDIINDCVKQYEAFGWELINNQRCQEYDGQTEEYNFDGTKTRYKNYSTFNKLTFTRDKSETWYREVAELEKEYNDNQEEINRLKRQKPEMPTETKTAGKVFINYMSGVLIFVGVVLLLFTIIEASAFESASLVPQLPLGIVTLLLGMSRFIIKKIRSNSRQKQYDEALYRWNKENKSKIDGIQATCEEIMQKSDKIINP